MGTLAKIMLRDDKNQDKWIVRLPSGKLTALSTENLCPMVTFQPTNEWQIVPAGEPLPAGLDVSLNMETGERWARLPPQEASTEEELSMEQTAQASVGLDSKMNDMPAV